MNIDSFVFSFLMRNESFFKKDIEVNSVILEREIKGKSLLVIGGAGTIGTSFIKAALKFEPAKLIVIDVNENGLTELVRDLRSSKNQFIPPEFVTYPLSFDSDAFRKLFRKNTPFDIIANFAAHKHVRSEKDIYSIEALLETNVLKAKKLLDILLNYPPRHFFCVSTDKAANPVNIMGASKKLMEEMILAYSTQFKATTARFANVAFSNGSLLDGFLRRIERKQPIACPNDVKRFFVAPQEAGEICLLACILGDAGEIFFPKMDYENDQIYFLKFIKPVLNYFNYEPVFFDSEEDAVNAVNIIDSGKYPVYTFKTDTSGEKLYEEFYAEGEQCNFNKYHSLGSIVKQPSYDIYSITDIAENLQKMFLNENLSKSDIVAWFKKTIPEFQHIETGRKLDNRM
jgi:FlaA1/EpsC-like NDP-sugar epimerase